MTHIEKAELKLALRKAIADAVDEVGLAALKRTSMFGSNDPAFKAARMAIKQAA